MLSLYLSMGGLVIGFIQKRCQTLRKLNNGKTLAYQVYFQCACSCSSKSVPFSDWQFSLFYS